MRRSGFKKKKINRENNNSLDVVSSCSPRTSLAGPSRGRNFTASAASSEQPLAQPLRAESTLDFGSHVGRARPGRPQTLCYREPDAGSRLPSRPVNHVSLDLPLPRCVGSWCEIEADYSNSASCAGGVSESEVATPKPSEAYSAKSHRCL